MAAKVERVIHVGLIGYGFAGRTFHAPVISSVSGLQLAKIVERGKDMAKLRYPSVEIVRDMESILDDPLIELVVVATPSTNHFDIVRSALLADKHVVCEKPFTVTTDEADAMINLARERNRVLSIFHNRRWDGDFLTIKDIITNGLIGQPMEFEAHWDRYQPKVNTRGWRERNTPGAGVLYDLGVHFADQALYLFGEPEGVYADIRVQREGGEAIDCFTVVLRYSGLTVTLKSSKLIREIGPRYIVHGTKGSYVKYGIDPQEEALKAGLSPGQASWGMESSELWGKLNTEIGGLRFAGCVETKAGAYQDFYANIYKAIAFGHELAVKPEEARNAIRLLELAQQSHMERRDIAW